MVFAHAMPMICFKLNENVYCVSVPPASVLPGLCALASVPPGLCASQPDLLVHASGVPQVHAGPVAEKSKSPK